MGNTYWKDEHKLETISVVIYACFVLSNICEKSNSYIDQKLVKSQIESKKEYEKTYHNILDPVFSYDGGEGQVARSILTSFIREFVWKKKKTRIYYNHNKNKAVCF